MTALLTILRPGEAGGPYELFDRLTILEAGLLYRDEFPYESVVARPDHRTAIESFHGIGPRHTWHSEAPWNPAPRDVYLQLIGMVSRGVLTPLRAAYADDGDVDPFRTVIPLSAVLEIARMRADAGSILTSLATWYSGESIRAGTETAFPNKRTVARRPPGQNYEQADRPLLAEMGELLATKRETSPWHAALTVADKAAGFGKPESKAKRLLGRYSAAFGSERDRKD